MISGAFFNVLLLCVVNVSFMLAETFLNSLVILSLRKSTQLRKKPCYFMILVLSCFDLAVIIVVHPHLIFSAVTLPSGDYEAQRIVLGQIGFYLCSFSMHALLTLNIERFLGLTYPIFHRTSVTKKRLLFLLTFLVSSSVVHIPLLLNIPEKTAFVVVTVDLTCLLFAFIYLNYKMFVISKSKRMRDRVAPREATTDAERKGRKLNFKNVSTCSLAALCFFVCSCPYIVYSALTHSLAKAPSYERLRTAFNTWAGTFVAMNSTFNCLLFFWRNLILRREGMQIIQRFWTSNS